MKWPEKTVTVLWQHTHTHTLSCARNGGKHEKPTKQPLSFRSHLSCNFHRNQNIYSTFHHIPSIIIIIICYCFGERLELDGILTTTTTTTEARPLFHLIHITSPHSTILTNHFAFPCGLLMQKNWRKFRIQFFFSVIFTLRVWQTKKNNSQVELNF